MDSNSTDEVNPEPLIEKTLEANPIPEESTENEFTTYYLKRLEIKVVKEEFRKKAGVSNIRYMLFALGLIHAVLSAIGLYFHNNEILRLVLTPHFQNLIQKDVMGPFLVGSIMFGIALLVISFLKHPRLPLAFWIYLVVFRIWQTIGELIIDATLYLLGVTNSQPALNYGYMLTLILYNIIIIWLTLSALLSGITFTLQRVNAAA